MRAGAGAAADKGWWGAGALRRGRGTLNWSLAPSLGQGEGGGGGGDARSAPGPAQLTLSHTFFMYHIPDIISASAKKTEDHV